MFYLDPTLYSANIANIPFAGHIPFTGMTFNPWVEAYRRHLGSFGVVDPTLIARTLPAVGLPQVHVPQLVNPWLAAGVATQPIYNLGAFCRPLF